MYEMNIPKDKFTVDVDERYLFGLIEKALRRAGNLKNLWKDLREKYCLEK